MVRWLPCRFVFDGLYLHRSLQGLVHPFLHTDGMQIRVARARVVHLQDHHNFTNVSGPPQLY